MSKYIIEIPDDVQYVLLNGQTDNKCYTAVRPIAELEVLNSDYINEHYGELQDAAYQEGINDGSLDVKLRVEGAYQRGYKDGRNIGIKDGMCEAWEAARKIALMDTETSENVTGYFGLFRIMENLTPMQAIEKLKAYEDKQKDRIEVGDEVIAPCGKAVVTLIETDDLVHYLYSGGDYGCIEPQKLKKTGKHYDIASILEAMRTHD